VRSPPSVGLAVRRRYVASFDIRRWSTNLLVPPYARLQLRQLRQGLRQGQGWLTTRSRELREELMNMPCRPPQQSVIAQIFAEAADERIRCSDKPAMAGGPAVRAAVAEPGRRRGPLHG